MRRIEWVGHRSVFSDPRVEYKMITGAYSPSEMKLLRKAAGMRNVRADGFSIRELRRDSPNGLSRYYQFGPSLDAYVQSVTDNDARIILSHPLLRHEFIDVTDEQPHGANRPDLVLPEHEIMTATKVDQIGRG